MNKKKMIFHCASIFNLIILVICVSYAAFTFTGRGSKENAITTTTVSMAYNEANNGIVLENAVPMTEEVGKTLNSEGQVFNFTVSLGSVGTDSVAYEVTAVKDDNSTLQDKDIRIHLEKSTDRTNYTEVLAPSNYISLTKASTIGSKIGQMVMDTGTMKANTTNYYRLRMWVDKDYEIADTAKSFSIKVNVYGRETQKLGDISFDIIDRPNLESSLVAQPTAPTPAEPKVCKKAGVLHTENCSQTSKTSYCGGSGYTASGSKKTTTITYGNLGQPETLTSGDAFDCDVNGDGVYDPATERFYYVDDNNSDIAALVYYNNVSSGVSNNKSRFAYDSISLIFASGPSKAVKELPKTTQWINVGLKNSNRNIIDENNKVKVENFSYEDYAARLLTIEEIKKACHINSISNKSELDNCNYLLENTKYSSSSISNNGYWLENSYNLSIYAWSVIANYRYLDNTLANSTSSVGVRPVIEVEKSDMEY